MIVLTFMLSVYIPNVSIKPFYLIHAFSMPALFSNIKTIIIYFKGSSSNSHLIYSKIRKILDCKFDVDSLTLYHCESVSNLHLIYSKIRKILDCKFDADSRVNNIICKSV